MTADISTMPEILEDVDDYEDGDLLTQLTKGFEALMGKVEDLVARNDLLQQQIDKYKGHIQDGDLPSTAENDASTKIARDETVDIDWRNQRRIAKGIEAWKKLRNSGTEAVPLNRERQKKFARYFEYGRPHTALEQDFTTNGLKGELKCPFATMVERRMSQEAASTQQRPSSLPTPPDLKDQLREDPIAAEFHAKDFHSPPASANESISKCPIRYLEDHSPEEVAKYFENHKHEIPRSHEICVKRYQSNAESIRQLDAKYGNLVNMIQGLGKKHKPMLPTEEEDPADFRRKSIDKVAEWAENCADIPEPEIVDSEPPEEAGDEVRSGHFERPLQEVRLGESPSRPWGIRVPLSERSAHSADGHEDVQSNTAQSIAAAQPDTELPPVQVPEISSPPRCPFGHGAPKASAKASVVSKDDRSNSPILTEPASTPKRDRKQDEKLSESLHRDANHELSSFQAQSSSAILRKMLQPWSRVYSKHKSHKRSDINLDYPRRDRDVS